MASRGKQSIKKRDIEKRKSLHSINNYIKSKSLSTTQIMGLLDTYESRVGDLQDKRYRKFSLAALVVILRTLVESQNN